MSLGSCIRLAVDTAVKSRPFLVNVRQNIYFNSVGQADFIHNWISSLFLGLFTDHPFITSSHGVQRAAGRHILKICSKNSTRRMANPEGQMSAIQGRHALPPQSFSLSQDPTEAMPGHSTKDFNSKWLLGPYIQWQSGNCTSLVKEGPAHTHSYTEPMFSFLLMYLVQVMEETVPVFLQLL